MFGFGSIYRLVARLARHSFGGGGDGGAGAARDAEAAREAKIAQATAGINEQFAGFDDSYFKNIADSYRRFQNPLFAEQHGEAQRRLPMGFATTASSAFQKKAADLERDASREQTQINSRGEDFANQQRSQVEANRSDLISQANAGTDAAASAAQALNRANALSRPPTFSPVADLFQKYTGAFANNQIAQNAGYNTGMPSLSFGVPKSAVTFQR